MTRRGEMWVRGIGLLLGLLVAAIAVAAWQIPRGSGTLGTDLIVSSAPTGELGVTPEGPIIRATGLAPGQEADAPAGTLRVQNQTGSTVYVQLRGLPSGTDLDGLLWFRIDSGDLSLFRGPVRELRSWTDRAITLVPGEQTTLSVRAWLPASVRDGYEGRIQTVDLELLATPAGS